MKIEENKLNNFKGIETFLKENKWPKPIQEDKKH